MFCISIVDTACKWYTFKHYNNISKMVQLKCPAHDTACKWNKLKKIIYN